MTQHIKRTIIIGGEGEMAQLLMPHLPTPVTIIDVKKLDKIGSSKFLPNDRAIRRQTSVALSETTKIASQENNFGSLCMVSVPHEVYEEASNAPGKSKICNLLGVSGRGYKSTLFIHQASSHSLPAEILDSSSGVVFGVHMLHGAKVEDFSEHTVVLTASNRMKKHDKYKIGHDYLSNFYRRLGYKHIVSMSPDRHDRIMSDIQFLTHSMFLIIGDAIVNSGYSITADNYHDLPSSILILLGRMGKQQPHVYKGIAIGNKYNKTVVDRLKGYKDVHTSNDPDWICNTVKLFKSIREGVARDIKLTSSECANATTPMSRVRDGIMNYSDSDHSEHVSTPNLKGGVVQYIEKYINSLSGDYDSYYHEVVNSAKKQLKVLDFELLTIKKFEAKR